MKTDTIIIIPAYNESDNLPQVVQDLQVHCPDLDFVIVNDCSSDNTVDYCRVQGLPYIDLYTNLGFSGAVQAGYRYAQEKGYQVAVQFDGDGQHPASEIPVLVDAIKSGTVDYALGSRFVTQKKPFTLRMMGSRIIVLSIYIRTGKWIGDPTSGMRAVSKPVIERMASNLNFIAEPDTLTRAILNGLRVREFQVGMRDRVAGVSHFNNPINSFKYMLRIVVSILFLQGKGW